MRRNTGLLRGCRSFIHNAFLLVLLPACAVAPSFLQAEDTAMRMTVVNNSEFSDDQVYFIMICQQPLGYFDFSNKVLVETPAFALDVSTMVATLAQLKEYSGDGSAVISCPEMGSSRIYFSLGRNFDQMGGFASSGPNADDSNLVPWAMFEVNLQNGKFLNQSNVDFFSIAYTLTAVKSGSGEVTVGITNSSKMIFDAFDAIPSPSDSEQMYGNTEIFKSLIIKNDEDETVRVVSPKAAALGSVNHTASLPQMFTHFLDDYVNTHCWTSGRTFSFSSKDSGDQTTYYGKVSGDGLTLSIYTDSEMTTAYASVPTLPRPSGSWGSPDFTSTPALWHNVGNESADQDNIDWGYLLFGQDGYSSGPGAHWALDPVAMAIPVSIVRGVMHLDNGSVDWKDSTKYYQGLDGTSLADYPIFYYGKILHQYGLAGHVYALSFDDIYGTDSGVSFEDPEVTLTLYPFATATPCDSHAVSDYDGDGETDMALYQDSTGWWYMLLSGSGYTLSSQKLGESGYSPVPADYDGDGKTDPAVYNESSGYWSIIKSGSSETSSAKWGDVGYLPVPADYDGDGKADLAVYCATGDWPGYWYILKSTDYSMASAKWGATGYSPVPADYDGDGITDLAVFCSSGDWPGYWYILKSTDYSMSYMQLGAAEYTPVPGDYDGDGKTDVAVYDEGSSDWYMMLSGSGYALSYQQFGGSGYSPAR